MRLQNFILLVWASQLGMKEKGRYFVVNIFSIPVSEARENIQFIFKCQVDGSNFKRQSFVSQCAGNFNSK